MSLPMPLLATGSAMSALIDMMFFNRDDLLRMMRTVAGIMRMYDTRIDQSSIPMVAFCMRHRAIKRPPMQSAPRTRKKMARRTVSGPALCSGTGQALYCHPWATGMTVSRSDDLKTPVSELTQSFPDGTAA